MAGEFRRGRVTEHGDRLRKLARYYRLPPITYSIATSPSRLYPASSLIPASRHTRFRPQRSPMPSFMLAQT
jgi:hypothetical protein